MNHMKTNRIMPELNWLRGIGALLIMLYHHTTRYEEVVGHAFAWQFQLRWGCDAVCLFFVLSGFLTVWMLSQNTTAMNFAKKRVIRIYPMYWVAILVTSAVMLLIMPERVLSITKILGNFLIFHRYLGIPSVDGVYWTLAVEMLFYLYVFAVLLLKLQKHIRWFLLLGTAASAVYLVGFAGMEETFVGKILGFAVMDQYGVMFFAGAFLAQIGKNKRDLVSWIGFACNLMLSILCHRSGYTMMLLICAAVILARLFAGQKQGYALFLEKWDRRLPLTYLAKISFPLYLTHQNIGRAMIQKMEQAGIQSELLILLSVCAACILLADLLHRFAEKPLENLCRKYILQEKRIKT